MKVNVKEFLAEAGITEAFYPGKRLVHACQQTGQFKSHCVVFDWRDPSKIRIELKAGLTGRTLDKKELKYYPISFQAPTHVDIEIVNDNEEEEKGSARGSSGSGGGGGLKKKVTMDDLKSVAFEAFGDVRHGKVPELGKIVDMVIMGKQIAEQSYGQVLETLAHQIQHAKITATELLAQAGKFVTKYTPPSFMRPTGNEDATYKYDRTKNADIGMQHAKPG